MTGKISETTRKNRERSKLNRIFLVTVIALFAVIVAANQVSPAYAASITISPTSGFPGSTISIASVSGLSSSSTYTDCLSTSSSSSSLCLSGSAGSLSTNNGGNIQSQTAVSVPTAAGAGSYFVILYGPNPGTTVVASATYTVNPSVTQPISLATVELGAPAASFSLSGCSVTPTTLVGDGNPHNVTSSPSCAITVSTPSDQTNSRYRFSGGTTTSALVTCSSGTCASFLGSYYYQIKNTYQATPVASTWDSGLSISITGTQLGTSGLTLCTLSPTAGSSSAVSCSNIWTDYNAAVSFAPVASGAGLNIQWVGKAPISFTQTSGGNTNNVNFYKQYTSVSFKIAANAQSTYD